MEVTPLVENASGQSRSVSQQPPLCIDLEAADFYVDTLDRVLTEGW